MHASDSSDHGPWYKQFWLLFILSFPAASVVLGLSLLTVSIITKDDMVVTGYYEEGNAINTLLGQMEVARNMQLAAHITIVDDAAITLALHGEAEPLAQNMLLDFGHWRHKHKDMQLTLSKGEDQLYHGQLPEMDHGKWYIDVYPAGNQPQWLIKTSAFFPANDITLTP